MAAATFKAKRVFPGGVALVAEVSVSVFAVAAEDPRSGHAVPGGQEFFWLRGSYGEKAIVDGPGFDLDRQHALRGARYALLVAERFLGRSHHAVLEQILCHPAHSTAGMITLAACEAVWKALDFSPPEAQAPRFEGRSLVFPE